MSTSENRPPGTIVLAGRTLANSSNSFRSPTFTERKPVPTGVASGPLSASPFFRLLATVASGRGAPLGRDPVLRDARAGRVGQRRAGGIDRGDARQLLVPAEPEPGRFEHLHGLGSDLGTDPVAGDQGDVVRHGPVVAGRTAATAAARASPSVV